MVDRQVNLELFWWQWDIELTVDNPILSNESTISGKIHQYTVNDDDNDDANIYSCAEVSASKQGYYGPFGLLVLASHDLQEQTSVYFYFTTIHGKWKALVCNDQSR